MLDKKQKKITKYLDARKTLKKHDHKILGLHSLINGSSVELVNDEWRLNIFSREEHPSFRFFEKIKIDGMAVNVKVVGELTPVSFRTEKQRPAPGGVSIGHKDISAGTLGTAVFKAGDHSAYILSNNHVLAWSNHASIGDAVLQPGPYDGGQEETDQIGVLTDYEPIDFIGGVNYIDAAIAKVDNYDDVSLEIYEITNWVGEIEEPEIGMTVEKSGRTSAVTESTISEFSGEIVVNYSFGPAIYDDQIITPSMVTGGDSGSLLLNKGSGKAVGLVFAGGASISAHCRINLVVDRFELLFFPARVEVGLTAVYNLISTEVNFKANYDIKLFEKEFKARYCIKGTNTEIDPYQIDNVYQLQHVADVAEYPMTYYRLSGTIDCSETLTWNDGEGFIPIAPGSYSHINGNYNEIRDLHINRPDNDFQGLFGQVPSAPDSIIKDIWIRDANITGKNYVGGLCARSGSRDITNCHFSGIVTGIERVGGVCGELYYGELRKCSAVGSVYGKNYVGGLTGRITSSSIYNSFSSANVLDHLDYVGESDHVGGLSGTGGTIIQHCYADGFVEKSSGQVGGLSYGTPTSDYHNYWDVEKTGQATSSYGEGKTTVEMRQQSTFVEWDFVHTWYNIETVTAPLLRQDIWLLERPESADATDSFVAVKLTDHMQEYSEATCTQEIVSLTDIIPAILEATESFHNQVNISTDTSSSSAAGGDFKADVIAARNRNEVSIAGVDFECINWTKWLIENKYYSKQYSFVLTGHQNGLSDLSLSISSFQARIRTDTPTYVAVVLPAESDTIAGINLRPDGELVVSIQYVYKEEIIYNQEISRVDLEDIRLDEGAVNRSISLSGHKTETFTSQSVDLSNPMIKRLIDGKRTYRCEPDIFVRPGDIVTINNETYQIDMVTWAVDAISEWMEIREA